MEYSPSSLPLVVDLDGTLTPTDTLAESVLALLVRKPYLLFLMLLWLIPGMGGRSRFKQGVSSRQALAIPQLPWRSDFLDWLKQQHASGRQIVLATAANHRIAGAVAAEIGIFASVLSSDARTNLKGKHKLHAIRRHLGDNFAYAGDAHADLPIWRAARAAVLVGARPALARMVRKSVVVEKEFAYPRASLMTWLRAIRVHQWLKNVLLFVPLCAAFAFADVEKVKAVLLGFTAFSLAASATYIMNDLWDLDSDRRHPRKKHRPFASGMIPLMHGVGAAAGLLASAFAIALLASQSFAAMLAAYVVLTTAYSLSLKRYMLVDVIMLAVLYTFRVLAGAVVTGITVTPWLLAFCVFIFFSLALVKRCAELVAMKEASREGAHGRDYRVSDLAILSLLGVGAGLCSVVVFGLYIGSPGAASHYGNANILWLAGIGLLYWIARIWIKTARGEMHDDPLVFAIRDPGCRVTALLMLCVAAFAHFVS